MVDVTISLDKGSPPVTECGIMVGTHYFTTLDDPLCPDCDIRLIEPPGAGTYNILINGLIDDSVYFICAYATNDIGTEYSHNNSEANCETYGALYQWDEAMDYTDPSKDNPSGVQGICPDGWHLPSFSEICQLTEAIDGIGNGGKLKTQSLQEKLNPL